MTETAWGIPAAAADLPDLPVVIDTGGGWEPYLDRFSLACVDLAMTAVLDQDRHGNAREPAPGELGPDGVQRS